MRCDHVLRRGLLLSCLSIMPLSAAAVTRPDTRPIVHVEQGDVRGIREHGVAVFKNIPFAAPPLGDLRWHAPVPAAPWAGIRDGASFGPSCAQNRRLENFAHVSAAEDCLTVNVFAPTAPRKPLPVMVWIYGGGLFVGGSDGYDAVPLARDGVVVVTFNYRVNAFGFLDHPALQKPGETANVGLADQRAALEWVKANIARFGGDPANVTIFGESAGGLSVLAHLVSPLSKGLFAKAIVQSGGYGFAESGGQRPIAAAQAAGIKFARESGCDQPDQTSAAVAACLLALPVDRILAKEEVAGSTLSIGGADLPETIGQALSMGHFAHVPVMIGGNRDEYRWFEALRELKAHQLPTADAYRDLFDTRFGSKAPAVRTAYSTVENRQPVIAFASAIGDQFFICPGQKAVAAMSRWTPVWNYEFADRKSPSYLPPVSFELGAAHTHELGYLFPGFGRDATSAPSSAGEGGALASQMRERWATFARSSNPNVGGASAWPKFDTTTSATFRFERDRSAVITSMDQDHHCALWESKG